MLSILTLHIHGTRDPRLELHRMLRNKYCESGTTRLIEYDGGYQIPIKSHNIETVVNGIIELA
ncbi:hypothetical protein EDB81DRAFT_777832 [Dactylonectria macrodidyma]|uniref:Serine hydrolase FSH domain-containing protein n=1 Tax=Dactylonectria macrodidyma TaxID=307937 RepID=A0A9P9FSX3_9HYPO|nr:hypothetical protein EDB81DRAFT_777832 [Dactylonectria macrodidyma]